MTVLVTGGTGYIGSHTCIELLNANHDVVILDNYYNSSPKVLNRIQQITGKDIIMYKGDIRDKTVLKKIFTENKINTVIHFAGLKAVGESCAKPLMYFDNNVSGTVTLCEMMSKHGVKNMIFSSSATVYGLNNPPYKENMKTGEVSNPYGRTKYMIEEILKDLCTSDKEFKVILLRYFNPIGAHESGLIGEDPSGIPNNLMPYISRVAINKLPELTIFGGDYDTDDGTCVRDYIHVVDLAQGHLKALEKLANIDSIEAYNLGTGTGYSVLELVHAFEKASGQKVKYRIGDRRPGDLPMVYANPDKAKDELHWTAKRNIDKMCEDTWRWQKNNPNGFQN